MQTRLLTLVAAVAAISSVSFASNEFHSYRLPITRDGVTKERVAYNFWSGEYPMPVIDVNSSVKGTTTIQAYKSLRSLPATQVSCTIKNGIYHPWGQTGNSVVNYYTLTTVNSYQAVKSFSIDPETQYPAGTVVDNVVYGSEGYCVGILREKGKPAVENTFSCDLVESESFKNLAPTAKDDGFGEQWLYVKCAEGYNAFVGDTNLLSQPGVKEGRIGGFGEAGPALPDGETDNQ